MPIWTRWFWPQRLAWVEYRWGTIRLKQVHQLGARVYIYTPWDEEMDLKPVCHEYIRRWAPYRPWWSRLGPVKWIDEDSEYKIKINERARPPNDKRFTRSAEM